MAQLQLISEYQCADGSLNDVGCSPTITGRFAIDGSFESATTVLFVPGLELVDGWPCAGTGDSDIESGARMTVRDIDGTLVGTGSLGSGALAVNPNVEDRTVPSGSSSEREEHVYAVADCVFEFTLPLLRQVDFYTIEMGGRNWPPYSHRELENLGWVLELTP